VEWSAGHRLRAAVAVTVALLAWPAAARAGLPAGYQRVSNERTRTAWSHVRASSVVRSAPSTHGHHAGRLRTRTFVGSREVVVVLGRWRDWTRVRYARLGAQVGWVPTRVLWPSKVSDALITVDRRAERLRAYRNGKLTLSVHVAVGAPASPTPAGTFFLRERVPASGVYGPLALGLNAFSRYRADWVGGGQVAIHGTNEPQLIPGHVSNGCVRLRNRDIRRLDGLAGVGTPVRIR
jgi:hypothetical protein